MSKLAFEHRGQRPTIDPTASIAPTAVVSGDVRIGRESRVAHGAVLTAEGGPLRIGRQCIIMENAVLRSTGRHPLAIGDHVLIGPRAYLSGCVVDDSVFLATGTTVFNGAHVGTRSEVRINGVVHVSTKLPPASVIPIGWIAVGDPATILPPNDHHAIWAIQEPLDFPRTVFGIARAPTGHTNMPILCARYSRWLAQHDADRRIDADGCAS